MSDTVKIRKVRYNTYELKVEDENSTVEEIRTYISELFPEIMNAEYAIDAEGTLVFTIRAGEKGN